MECEIRAKRRGQRAERKLQKELEEVFEGIDFNDLISEIMDAIFFGYSVVELTWKKDGKILRPDKIIR